MKISTFADGRNKVHISIDGEKSACGLAGIAAGIHNDGIYENGMFRQTDYAPLPNIGPVKIELVVNCKKCLKILTL